MNPQEYYEWLQKFDRKHTTDECFTPPEVYDAVVRYVVDFFKLQEYTIDRPFYPGGDYQAAIRTYKDHTVVIDNPPFSQLADIIKTYKDNDIPYFLFCQAKTALGLIKQGASIWFSPQRIKFENGARVGVAYATNLEDKQCIRTVPDLRVQPPDTPQAKNKYPDNLYIFSHFESMTRRGIAVQIPCDASMLRTHFDDPGRGKVQVYGKAIQLPAHYKTQQTEYKHIQTQAKNVINQLLWKQ